MSAAGEVVDGLHERAPGQRARAGRAAAPGRGRHGRTLTEPLAIVVLSTKTAGLERAPASGSHRHRQWTDRLRQPGRGHRPRLRGVRPRVRREPGRHRPRRAWRGRVGRRRRGCCGERHARRGGDRRRHARGSRRRHGRIPRRATSAPTRSRRPPMGPPAAPGIEPGAPFLRRPRDRHRRGGPMGRRAPRRRAGGRRLGTIVGAAVLRRRRCPRRRRGAATVALLGFVWGDDIADVVDRVGLRDLGRGRRRASSPSCCGPGTGGHGFRSAHNLRPCAPAPSCSSPWRVAS